MRKKVVVPNCEICGDKGVGRNFGAISCESCKTFFRRNSLKPKEIICKFNNNCIVKSKYRNRCKKCRLAKCYAMGMKKEFIQSKEQNELRKIKIQLNKQKRAESIDTSENSSSSTIELMASDVESNTVDSQVISDVFENNRNVYRNVLLTLNKSIDDQIDDNSLTDQSSDAPSDPMNKQLTQYLSAPLLRPIDTYKDLSQVECRHLLDLCLASNVFRYPKTPENLIKVSNIHEFYANWGTRIESDTHCLVSLLKDLTKNVDICLNDQIALVKYGSMEISVLRANYNYDLQAENWTLYVNDNYLCVFPIDMLKGEKRNLYGVYKSHFNKITPEWNWDRVLVDLLTVIILFNPNRPNIINSDIIKFRQQMYIYLLQRYLSMKYRWDWLWNYKMSNLMNALVDLKIVGRIEILNGIEDYIDYFGPVSREMFTDIYKDCTQTCVV